MTRRLEVSLLLAALALALSLQTGQAQDAAPTPPSAPQPVPQSAPESAPPAAAPAPRSAGLPNPELAWSMLSDNAAPGRSAHDRIQAMAALGSMGTDERAAKLIGPAIIEHNSDVRIAAILAAGLSNNPALIPQLKIALDDDNPQVAYTAALTLWKMHDTSGEDLLLAVAEGDRKAKPGLIKTQKHKAAKELHSPKAMSMIAVNQASGYFLGPFGVGLKAIEMASKNSGAITRAQAVDELARQHSDAVREALVDGLTDPEPAVRAASVKGLGNWPGPDSARQIYPLFGDTHLAVRLTAAAAYLRVQHGPAEPANTAAGAQ